MLLIVADVHEQASSVPRLLQELGARVDTRTLTRGDYVVGPETIVERKTAGDLHATIEAGRFWPQMRKIRSAARSPYLLIEGLSVYRGPVPATSVRSLCLAVTDLGITIIRTEDKQDTAEWLCRLAIRRRDGASRDRPVYAQRPQSTTVSPAEAALASAPGVSAQTARTVLARFGSLRAVSEASVGDLQALPGVGIRRATAIAALIHDPWNATSAH
jgi:DNA excision repair protein ERCC-4